jgi:uncharacterized Zn finger protein
MTPENEIRCECPQCAFDGPHDLTFITSGDAIVECGDCGHSFMAQPTESLYRFEAV